MPNIPFYRKVETRRLMSRATHFTNLFYQNTISSLALIENLDKDKASLGLKWGGLIPQLGGPVLCTYSGQSARRRLPLEAIQFLIDLLSAIFNKLDNQDVALLVPFRETLSQCQREIKPLFSEKSLLIETVDRVQGLDVDYCFYVLPDASYAHSLQQNRFNVATSRARKVTFIVAHHLINKLAVANPAVMSYLRQIEEDYQIQV